CLRLRPQTARTLFPYTTLFLSYLRNDAANAALIAGEWRNSGDLGYMVAGEIHVTGRRKDMIIRAGRNIFPAELETAIGALDGISDRKSTRLNSSHVKISYAVVC